MKKTLLLLIAFLSLFGNEAKAYIQDESVALGTLCTNTCTTYTFIIASNQSYYEWYYMTGKSINNLTEREKQYYISALVNVYNIKNNFKPLYK